MSQYARRPELPPHQEQKPWTPEELAVAYNAFDRGGYKAMAKVLPHRSVNSLRGCIRKRRMREEALLNPQPRVRQGRPPNPEGVPPRFDSTGFLERLSYGLPMRRSA